MRVPDRSGAELNELRWWSRWAKLRRRGDGYLLSSEELNEPFFNRAQSLSCRGLDRVAAWAERQLGSLGVRSTFLVFDSCGAARRLLASGYRQVDTMFVLASRGPLRVEDGSSRVAASTDARRWASAYLRSFYESEGLAGVVCPIVAAVSKARAVTLLESRIDGETAGVLALFRTPGLAGAYCVGTVPEHRRRGVATALLAEARRIAEAEERAMVVQTLASEGALKFYLKRGFAQMYSKRVLEKKLK